MYPNAFREKLTKDFLLTSSSRDVRQIYSIVNRTLNHPVGTDISILVNTFENYGASLLVSRMAAMLRMLIETRNLVPVHDRTQEYLVNIQDFELDTGMLVDDAIRVKISVRDYEPRQLVVFQCKPIVDMQSFQTGDMSHENVNQNLRPYFEALFRAVHNSFNHQGMWLEGVYRATLQLTFSFKQANGEQNRLYSTLQDHQLEFKLTTEGTPRVVYDIIIAEMIVMMNEVIYEWMNKYQNESAERVSGSQFI